MNITSLSNGLRQLAEKRRDECIWDYPLEDNLSWAFDWSKTNEGKYFWAEISAGNFSEYGECYAEHSWILDYPDEYQIVADAYGNTIVAKVGDYVQPPFDTASIGTKIHEEMEDFLDSGYLGTPAADTTGIKESQNKLSYQEIDFNFVDLMAASMTKNKDKYPPFNWHKPINKLDLVDAILRHTRKVKQPIEGDVESAEEHLVNIACNSMMLWYQYVNYK